MVFSEVRTVACGGMTSSASRVGARRQHKRRRATAERGQSIQAGVRSTAACTVVAMGAVVAEGAVVAKGVLYLGWPRLISVASRRRAQCLHSWCLDRSDDVTEPQHRCRHRHQQRAKHVSINITRTRERARIQAHAHIYTEHNTHVFGSSSGRGCTRRSTLQHRHHYTHNLDLNGLERILVGRRGTELSVGALLTFCGVCH